MADQTSLTDDSALKQFLQIPESQVPSVATPPDPMLPRARAALEQVTGPLSEESFIEQEQRPGVPLQINPGEGEMGTFSPWLRFQTARRQTQEDQQKYLETQFPGEGRVRKTKSGDNFIIQVTDPATGKPKDVLLDENEITVSDLGALAKEAPELGLGILASAFGGPIGAAAAGPKPLKYLMKFAGTGPGRALLGAAGYKLGQAGEQFETEKEQGQKAYPLSILAEKGKEIPGQAMADLFTAGIFKGASTLNRLRKGGPGMFQTPVEKEGLAAEARVGPKYGQRLSYSAGAGSGMPLLDYLQAYAQAKPQASAIVHEFEDLQQAEKVALAKAMTPQAGTDEEAGQALSNFLTFNRQKKQEVLDRIRATMTKQESDALTRQLGRVAPVGQPFDPSVMGAQFRGEVQGVHAGVKAQVHQAYQDAYGVPGADAPAIPTKAIVDEIDSMVSPLSHFQNVQGVQWLKQYRNTLGPTESYKQIVNRRSDLWDKIEQSPADRSTKDYLHSSLSSVMTATLDDASKNILNSQFRTLIQKANQLYKTKELPFYQEGLHDILRKAGQRGSPENMELLDRFSKNTDLYQRLTQVLGKGSPAAGVIKSSVIDGLLSRSGTSAIDPQFVDAGSFVKNLNNFFQNPKTREMARDIFGSQANDLMAQAKLLSGIQGTISKEDAEALLAQKAGGKYSLNRLQRVVDAQNQVDRVEAHRLLKSPTEFINPEDLANRYVDHLTQSELQGLSTQLNAEAPGVAQKMREKLTEQIFGKAGGAEGLNSASLRKALHDPKREAKYKVMLGPMFKDIDDFASALGPRDRALEIGKATGLLIKGEAIGELAKPFEIGGSRHRPPLPARLLGLAPGWLGWKMAAQAITSGTFREWASKGYPKGWEHNITAGIITEPFLADLAQSSAAPENVRHVALAVRNWAKRVTAPAESKPDQPPLNDMEELRKFLQQ